MFVLVLLELPSTELDSLGTLDELVAEEDPSYRGNGSECVSPFPLELAPFS